MAESIKSKFKRAINGGFICVVTYKDRPGKRYIEPVVLGKTTARNPAIRAFQRRGFSEGGENRAWKLFLLSEFSSVRVTNRKFSVRALYNPADRGMRSIEASFEFQASLNSRLNRIVDEVLEFTGIRE